MGGVGYCKGDFGVFVFEISGWMVKKRSVLVVIGVFFLDLFICCVVCL